MARCVYNQFKMKLSRVVKVTRVTTVHMHPYVLDKCLSRLKEDPLRKATYWAIRKLPWEPSTASIPISQMTKPRVTSGRGWPVPQPGHTGLRTASPTSWKTPDQASEKLHCRPQGLLFSE